MFSASISPSFLLLIPSLNVSQFKIRGRKKCQIWLTRILNNKKSVWNYFNPAVTCFVKRILTRFFYYYWAYTKVNAHVHNSQQIWTTTKTYLVNKEPTNKPPTSFVATLLRVRACCLRMRSVGRWAETGVSRKL